jgi:hypothetical protein
LQQDALKEAGCEKIIIEQMSGEVSDRPAFREALDYARSGDTVIVWKLDRLARSMKQLVDVTAYGTLTGHLTRALKTLGLKREPRDVTPTLQNYLDARQQPEEEDAD